MSGKPHQIKIISDFSLLPLNEITALNTVMDTPFFYDVRFLEAAHYWPLLPILKAYYILAYSNTVLVGFTVVYTQISADPFGSLAHATGRNFNEGLACMGHIMHCYETEVIVSIEQGNSIRRAILKSIRNLGSALGAKHVGLINVTNRKLLLAGALENYQTRFIWDRYLMEIDQIQSVEDYIASLPADGRREMNRQRRKFQASRAHTSTQKIDMSDLVQISELVWSTSARHGTPNYYPKAMLKPFLEACGKMTRFVTVHEHDLILGVMVCFVHNKNFHVWAAGMSYDRADFSPYSICMLEAFRYAKQEKLQVIEIGRTNHKIKTRMGFKAKKLFSLIASS
ncbi:GNAT family N-acetyltransferase [Pseudomonas phoenicis]|uniref:GNAT family N-acetyltransferase n=1 Tax=unclassified Pseudomonas TaxID=196821 RepID=UPI00399F42A3